MKEDEKKCVEDPVLGKVMMHESLQRDAGTLRDAVLSLHSRLYIYILGWH